MDSTKQTARLAGLAYLLLGISSVFGFVCVPLVQADPTAIARLITTSELRFRIGIVSDLLSNVFGILLVWFLYKLLKPVDRNLAALMAILLLVTVPVSFIITLTDVAAKVLLSGANFLSAFTKPQLDALAMLFLRLHIHEVFAVEIFWGLWLLPFGLLVFRSRFLPRVLGVFLIIAGFAYAAHSLVSLLLPGPRHAVYELATMVGRGIGELPIILWLLIKGADSGAGKDAGAPRDATL